MINAFFFESSQINSGGSRPADGDRVELRQLRIDGHAPAALAAALASAMRRVSTVVHLEDRAQADAAERGLALCMQRAVAAGRLTADRAAAARALIAIGRLNDQAVAGLRLVTAGQGPVGPADSATIAVLLLPDATRQGPLPAGAVGLRAAPDLLDAAVVEVVRGEGCEPAALARVYDFLLQIGKTPIIVSDSEGGFLQRVGRAAGAEGLLLCREGLAPVLVENVTRQTDMAVGALSMAERYGLGRPEGIGSEPHVVDEATVRHVQDRFLFIQALEALRCLEAGVIDSVRDANIASIEGLGFPTWSGGAVQYANQYGLGKFLERAAHFARHHGERFAPPLLLRECVAAGASSIE